MIDDALYECRCQEERQVRKRAMPFVARDKDSQARIDITAYTNPRAELRADQIICQLCEARMLIRQGFVVRPHFAHTIACPVAYQSHPESVEHLLGKAVVSEWLRRQPSLKGTTVELEVPIHHRKRIADILVTFPFGHRLAVEIQLAGITTQELEARTKDYFADGIDVIWVLGKTAAGSVHNFNWCRMYLGGYLHLSFTENTRVDVIQLPGSDLRSPTARADGQPLPQRDG